MNGKFPPWNAHGGYTHEEPYVSNKQQGLQELDSNNDDPAHYGEVTTHGNYGERSRDSQTTWPHTAQQKEPDKTRGILSVGPASLYTHSASKYFSTDCQGKPADSIDYYCFPDSQHSIMSIMGDIADNCGERTATEKREGYSLANDCLAEASTNASHILNQEKNQELERGSFSKWTSVIKEALEMSNGIELEQAPSCKSLMVYEDLHSEAREMEAGNDHFDSVNYRCTNVQDKYKTEEMSSAPNSDKALEQSSHLGFCNTTELCSIEQQIPTEQKETSIRLYLQESPIRLTLGEQSQTLEHTHRVPSATSGRMNTGFKYNSPEVPDVFDHMGRHECTESEMKVETCTTFENQKPVGSVVMEENHSLNIIKGKSKGDTHQVPPKSNVHNERLNTDRECVSKNISANPSSVSTSVSKLEDLVHNLYKVVHPPPALGLKIQADTTSETATECEDSNLPLSQEKSLNKTSKAEYTLMKEAASTPKTTCSAVLKDPQKVVKKQTKQNTRRAKDVQQIHAEKTEHGCSIQSAHNMETQKPSFQDSAAEVGDLTSDEVQSMKMTGNLDKLNTHKAQARKRKKANVFGVNIVCSSNPEPVESDLFSPASQTAGAVSQKVKKTGRSPREKMVPDEKNSPILITSFCESIKETSHLAELPTSNEINPPTAKQENVATAFTIKDEEQGGIKRQHPLDCGVPVSEDHIHKRTRSKRNKRWSTLQLQSINTPEQTQSPCELSSVCTESTSVNKVNRTSNINVDTTKITKNRKKINQDSAASVVGATEDCCTSQTNLQSSPASETEVLNVVNVSGMAPTSMGSQTVTREDGGPSFVPVSEAERSMDAKMHTEIIINKTSSDSASNLKEVHLSCDIVKPLASTIISENAGINLSSLNTTKKCKKRKSRKASLGSTQICPVVSTDNKSSASILFEKPLNSAPDTNDPDPTSPSKGIKSQATIHCGLQEMMQSEAQATSEWHIPNTLAKAKNSRKKRKLKKDNVQGLNTSIISQTNSSHLAEGMVKTTDLLLSVEDVSIVKASEGQRCKHSVKTVKKKTPKSLQNTKTSRRVCVYVSTEVEKELDNTFQPAFEIKTEPEEGEDYSKKLRQRTSTSKNHSLVCKNTKKVKLEPDIYNQGYNEVSSTHSENVSDFPETECVSVKEEQKDCSAELAKYEHKRNQLRILRTCVIKKKRTGCSFKKRNLKKLANPLTTDQENSDNASTQHLLSDFSRNVVKTEETVMKSCRRSCRTRQNRLRSSIQTRSRISLMSEPCESPEHEQTTFTHSLATMDTDSGCNVFRSAGQKPPRRRSKKRRKSRLSGSKAVQAVVIYSTEKTDLDSKEQTSLLPSNMETELHASDVSKSGHPMECQVPSFKISDEQSIADAENDVRTTAPTNLIKQKAGQPCRKKRLLKISTASELELSPSKKTSCSQTDMKNMPQAVPAHAKKRGKKSKMQLTNFSVLSLRHSKRLSKFHLGMNMKPQSHNKKKNVKKKSNISEPLHKNRCDVTDSCHKTASSEEKDQKTNEDGSLGFHTSHGHCLKGSEEKMTRVATRMLSKTGTFNSKITGQKQRLVGTKFLESKSSAETQITCAEKQKDKCVQKNRRCQLKRSLDVEESGKNPDVKTRPKNKRKMTTWSSGHVSPNKTTSQQESSRSDRLLDNFEDSLKAEIPNDEHPLRDVEINSAKGRHPDYNKILLNAETREVQFALTSNLSSNSKRKDVKRGGSKKKARKENKSKAVLSTESKTDTAFELSLQSFVNATGLCSSVLGDVNCDKKIKDIKKPIMDASVRASDLDASGMNDAVANQSPGDQKVDVFTQYCNEDKATLAVDNTVKMSKARSVPKEFAKKCIICKYCGQSFRHVSAYTIHQRIHTGEKPYRCRICGKNFAQLSRLKSHRKSHKQSIVLCCPCCSKKFSQKNALVSHFKTHLQESENSEPGEDIQGKHFVASSSKNIFPNKFMVKVCVPVHEEEKPLSCKTCGKHFQKSSKLLVHEKTHWPVKPYACSLCRKGFSQLKALKKHSQEHTGEMPFSCSHCGHAFHDLSALQMHQKTCSSKGNVNRSNCDIEGFLVSQGVDGHVNTPVFFRCLLCRQLCQKWCQYTLHLQTHTKSPPYLCFACGQSYQLCSEITVHCSVCCHSSGEEAACGAAVSTIFQSDGQKCSSQNTSNLNPCSLQISETPKSASQSEMPVKFLQSPSKDMEVSSLPETRHDIGQLPANQPTGPSSPTPSVITCVSSTDSLECIEISPSLWKFECPRCGQRYKQYRTLFAHMQTHAPGFRYVCGHCGQSFKRWNRLWLHQRIHHVKSRYYSCSQCNLEFRFLGSYKEHMLNHAGERPIACPLCPETFAHEESLHAHQCELHKQSNVLQCDVCAKTFRNLRSLIKHSLLHNGAMSHQCLPCKLSFTNNKIFQEHLKTHHYSHGLPLPDIPAESLQFPHKCKRCKASFSSGDLLYAHQVCHFRSQICPTHVSQSTSSVLTRKPHPRTESPLRSTSRPLLSSLNLDAIPDERLYAYPHPDRLYVMPRLSRIQLQIISVDSEDEENPLPKSSSHVSLDIVASGSECSDQKMPDCTPFCSEKDTTHLPQALKSQESTHIQSQSTECTPAPHTTVSSSVQHKASSDSVTQTVNFVETVVLLEEQSSNENSMENKDCECVDCGYKASSLLGLHEHYFLQALGYQLACK